MSVAAPKTIDAYLKTLPERSREMLEEIRKRISVAAPEALEGIKYGMPTASLGGTNIIYYAAWKKHIGLYPVYRASPKVEAALAPYRDKKDTVRFTLDQPVPYDIVDLILHSRLDAMRRNAD
jgi:uncharacterized protein YdhG (YjbR/CyaY superfamily)